MNLQSWPIAKFSRVWNVCHTDIIEQFIDRELRLYQKRDFQVELAISGDSDNENKKKCFKNLQNIISEHLFNEMLHFIHVSPDELVLDKLHRTYLRVQNVSLYHLVHPDFFNNVIKLGGHRIYMIPFRDDCDDDLDIAVENSVALFPIEISTPTERDSGLSLILSLSVDEKTYHRLGIAGSRSILHRKNIVSKYNVRLSLRDLHRKPLDDSKQLQKVLQAMERIDMKFDFYIQYDPDETIRQITQQELHKLLIDYFEKRNVTVVPLEHSVRTWTRENVPFVSNFNDNHNETTAINELIKWNEAQTCALDLYNNDYGPLNSILYQSHSDAYGPQSRSISVTRLVGFFTPFDALNYIKHFLFEPKTTNDIRSMIFNGFENSPIAWCPRRAATHNIPPVSFEHGKQHCGENILGLIKLNDSNESSSSASSDRFVVYAAADEYSFGIETIGNAQSNE